MKLVAKAPAELVSKLRSGAIFRSLSMLTKKDQKKIYFGTILQLVMNILDLIGVAAIGMLGALAVRGIQSKPAGDRVNQIMTFFGISNWSFQYQAGAIAIFAGCLLVFRTVFSVVFQRRLLHFLSRCSSDLAKNLVSKYFNLNLTQIKELPPQDILYSVTAGTDALTVRLLGSVINMISDLFLLILLCFALFFVSPAIAILTVLGFGLTGVVLHMKMRESAEKLSRENAYLKIETSEKFLETANSIRELKVQNRVGYFVEKITQNRAQIAKSSAELSFLPTVSKYVLETAVVVGTVVIGASQFILQDAYHASANLAVFLAAGSRIAPAILRIQQGAVQIRASGGEGIPTLEVIEKLVGKPILNFVNTTTSFSYPGFDSSVEIENLFFKYPGNSEYFFESLNLDIKPNSNVAIVGPSGAGKTTLVDIILGLIDPDAGSVALSGVSPRESIKKWPGAISYVPQEINLISGTISENIVFGHEPKSFSLSRIENVILQSGLFEYVSQLELGLDTQIGSRGLNLSGGQKQRLGIARALYSNPSLIILDEATSALDARTELEISKSLDLLRTNTTIISIAHRLSTVRKADIVVYLERGRILAQGTFEEVRNQVPDFDSNAKLLGL